MSKNDDSQRRLGVAVLFVLLVFAALEMFGYGELSAEKFKLLLGFVSLLIMGYDGATLARAILEQAAGSSGGGGRRRDQDRATNRTDHPQGRTRDRDDSGRED